MKNLKPEEIKWLAQTHKAVIVELEFRAMPDNAKAHFLPVPKSIEN